MTTINYIKYIIFTLFFGLISNTSFCSSDLPEGALSYPVFVSLENKASATGFYLVDNSHFYFVTARHVLFDVNVKLDEKTPQYPLISKTMKLLSYSKEIDNPKKIEYKINLEALLKDNLIRYHNIHDVAVVKMGIVKRLEGGYTNTETSLKYVQRLSESNDGIIHVDTLWIKKINQVLIGNEVFLFGYPNSIGIKEIPQIDYEKPLLRKGIIAGKNINNNTIVIDCPVFYGNSGGPVLQIEKEGLSSSFRTIGVVSQFVPFVEEWENKKHRYSNFTISNSGYSVIEPMDMVLELLWK